MGLTLVELVRGLVALVALRPRAEQDRTVVPAATKEECCTLCAARPGCAAGVFAGTECWIKTAKEKPFGACDVERLGYTV